MCRASKILATEMGQGRQVKKVAKKKGKNDANLNEGVKIIEAENY